MEFASSTVFAVTNANRRLLPEYLSNITYDQKEGRKVISFISFLCYLYYSQLKKTTFYILKESRQINPHSLAQPYISPNLDFTIVNSSH